jgi:ribonuclease E
MQKCPRCEGHGFIKTTQATALTILRKIRAEAMKDDTNEIRVQVPVDIAAYILNEKRDSIVDIERISEVRIMIIPNFNMESPKFQMQRIWGSSYKSNRSSSDLIEDVYNVEIPKAGNKKVAAVDLSKAVDREVSAKVENKAKHNEQRNQQAPQQKEETTTPKAKEQPSKKGFFAKLASVFTGTPSKPVETAKDSQKPNNKNNNSNNNSQRAQTNKPQRDNKQRNDRDRNNNNNNLNDQRNKNKNNKAQDNSQKPQQRENNQRNERNNSDNRSNDRNKNKRNNDRFDKKPNNKNNNRSNNISLNNAEEVIDITKVKYSNQISENNVDNIKKVISKNPDEFVSVMVKDVLENYDSLKDDGATKVNTEEKVKTQKYLKFNTISVDNEISAIHEAKKEAEKALKEAQEKAKADQEKKVAVEEQEKVVIEEVKTDKEEVISQKTENKDAKKKSAEPKASQTKEKCVEKNTKKESVKKDKPVEKNTQTTQQSEYINYSPALDFESQALI